MNYDFIGSLQSSVVKLFVSDISILVDHPDKGIYSISILYKDCFLFFTHVVKKIELVGVVIKLHSDPTKVVLTSL